MLKCGYEVLASVSEALRRSRSPERIRDHCQSAQPALRRQ
jgi:hypothetical protein